MLCGLCHGRRGKGNFFSLKSVGFLGAILTNYHKLGNLKTIEIKSLSSGV